MKFLQTLELWTYPGGDYIWESHNFCIWFPALLLLVSAVRSGCHHGMNFFHGSFKGKTFCGFSALKYYYSTFWKLLTCILSPLGSLTYFIFTSQFSVHLDLNFWWLLHCAKRWKFSFWYLIVLFHITLSFENDSLKSLKNLFRNIFFDPDPCTSRVELKLW